MKKSTLKIILCDIFFLLFTLLNVFVINIKNLYVLSFFNLLFAFVIIMLFGYKKNRNRFRKDIILNIIFYTFTYMTLFYMSGLIIGFLNNIYSLKMTMIIKNISGMLLFIITTEFFRYCLNNESQSNKFLIVLSVIIFLFIELAIYIGNYNLNSLKDILKLIWCITIPLLSKNILLTFISIRYGMLSTSVYRIIMELYVFIVPIIPNFDEYLTSVIGVLFPVLIFYLVYRSYIRKEKKTDVRSKKIDKYFSCTLLIMSILIVALTSQLFPIFVIAVGSGSMAKTINMGDAVIVNKTKNIKENDIIVFKYDNKVIVHRVIEKDKINNENLYKTKGDNNLEIDNWVLEEKMIIGKAIAKIPIIGYPTVWLNRKLD